jgi:RimJ/RimL family protein N-acetyltransferase
MMLVLKGKQIRLRHVRERDLDALYDIHTDISTRGDFYPAGTYSEPAFRKEFQETGFWKNDEGLLLIVDDHDSLLGEIEFFRTLNYLDELEIGYRLYSPEYAGRGVMTEALGLMTAYLFEQKRFNRIRLIIHPDNAASRRIAEKCGYRHESTMRGAWFHRGRHHDAEVYAMLREDPRTGAGT